MMSHLTAVWQLLLVHDYSLEGLAGSGIQVSSPMELSLLWSLLKTDLPSSHPVRLEDC